MYDPNEPNVLTFNSITGISEVTCLYLFMIMEIYYITPGGIDFCPMFNLHCRYGEIESIRVLHERFCAFVNFKSAHMAARAMEKLNVSVVPLSTLGLFFTEHCCGP